MVKHTRNGRHCLRICGIFSLLICLMPLSTYASAQLINIQPGVDIYAEYYPNLTAKFKGTIIFENGSGASIGEWKANRKFLNCVKKVGNIFLYDRSGLGKSPPDLQVSSANPITVKMVSDKLSKLLKQQNIRPPYLFVSHSYGALYSAYFTLKYPNLVKGIILVDPVPRGFHFSAQLMRKYEQGLKDAKLEPTSVIYKKQGSKADVLYQLLGFEKSKQSIKLLGNFNDEIPIIIFSSSGMVREHPIQEDWYMSQKQWLNKNEMSKIVQVHSGHFIQLEQPNTICAEIKSISNLLMKQK